MAPEVLDRGKEVPVVMQHPQCQTTAVESMKPSSVDNGRFASDVEPLAGPSVGSCASQPTLHEAGHIGTKRMSEDVPHPLPDICNKSSCCSAPRLCSVEHLAHPTCCNPVPAIPPRRQGGRVLPRFAVPKANLSPSKHSAENPDNNAAFVDGNLQTEEMVHMFAAGLISGATLQLAVDGIGTIGIELYLDHQLANFSLIFNNVQKLVPLSTVRHVVVERTVQEDGTAKWQVRLDLQDDRYCILIFDDTPSGMQEAQHFGGCTRILSEAARFEAVKADLACLGTLQGSEGNPLLQTDAMYDATPSAAMSSRSGPTGDTGFTISLDQLAVRLREIAATQRSSSKGSDPGVKDSGAAAFSRQPAVETGSYYATDMYWKGSAAVAAQG